MEPGSEPRKLKILHAAFQYGGLPIVSMPVLPKMVYRFIAILIKTPMGSVRELDLSSKFMSKGKKPRRRHA